MSATGSGSLLLALSLLAHASTHPVDQETTLNYATTELDQHVLSLQKNVDLVGFIENFKQVMAQYVSSQYKNLTIAEMEKVKITLEEFLQNFATDLRETIENKNTDDVITTDEINEEPFAEIKRKIVIEFPEVTENIADRIIVKLRKNLYNTRNKLDDIIRESYKAQLEYSQ